MSYLTQAAISQNTFLFNRVAQCAAQQEVPQPDQWTNDNRRAWAASPGWDAAWESAMAAHPPATEPDYDPGKDEAVITDAMILSEVQALYTPPAAP